MTLVVVKCIKGIGLVLNVVLKSLNFHSNQMALDQFFAETVTEIEDEVAVVDLTMVVQDEDTKDIKNKNPLKKRIFVFGKKILAKKIPGKIRGFDSKV